MAAEAGLIRHLATYHHTAGRPAIFTDLIFNGLGPAMLMLRSESNARLNVVPNGQQVASSKDLGNSGWVEFAVELVESGSIDIEFVDPVRGPWDDTSYTYRYNLVMTHIAYVTAELDAHYATLIGEEAVYLFSPVDSPGSRFDRFAILEDLDGTTIQFELMGPGYGLTPGGKGNSPPSTLPSGGMLAANDGIPFPDAEPAICAWMSTALAPKPLTGDTGCQIVGAIYIDTVRRQDGRRGTSRRNV